MAVSLTKSEINYKTFNQFLKKNFLFENNPAVTVGVSGGPDSMALLFLIKNWIDEVKGNLTAIIVDHGIRNKSKFEAKLIQKVLKNHNIKSKILSVNKNQIINKSMKEARDNRYNLINNYCIRKKILHLFLAHHFDDNLETFLNRKIAGSDFEGLQSIKENIVIKKLNIIRPLLNYSKKQIYEFNKINNIYFIEDETNKNLNYTRPVIRKFLKTSNTARIQTLKDFNLILNKMPLYKRMIFEILNNHLIYVDESIIKINYSNLTQIHDLLIEKIIKKIYEFWFKDEPYLRSKKIFILINLIKNKNFNKFVLSRMIVKKVENILIFSPKIS